MKLDQLTNSRVAQLYDMRGAGGFPPRMPAKDRLKFRKWGLCDESGRLAEHVLSYLLKLETAQLPVWDSDRDRVQWLAPSEDGTACYVRVSNWEGTSVQFWLMINFRRCMFGV